jgi:hypothetical protein
MSTPTGARSQLKAGVGARKGRGGSGHWSLWSPLEVAEAARGGQNEFFVLRSGMVAPELILIPEWYAVLPRSSWHVFSFLLSERSKDGDDLCVTSQSSTLRSAGRRVLYWWSSMRSFGRSVRSGDAADVAVCHPP